MPRALAAALALHVISLIAVSFPPDAAHVPKRLLEVALITAEHPSTRVRFHAFAPARWQDRFEKPLDPTHPVSSRLFFIT